MLQDVEMWDCPFCGKKSVLKIMNLPKTFRQYKTTWGGSRPGIKVTQPQFIIQFNECPNCKKTVEEIEKKWKEEGLI